MFTPTVRCECAQPAIDRLMRKWCIDNCGIYNTRQAKFTLWINCNLHRIKRFRPLEYWSIHENARAPALKSVYINPGGYSTLVWVWVGWWGACRTDRGQIWGLAELIFVGVFVCLIVFVSLFLFDVVLFFFLFYLILSYLILSCLVLSCLVLSCLVLSCLVLFCLVLFLQKCCLRLLTIGTNDSSWAGFWPIFRLSDTVNVRPRPKSP